MISFTIWHGVDYSYLFKYFYFVKPYTNLKDKVVLSLYSNLAFLKPESGNWYLGKFDIVLRHFPGVLWTWPCLSIVWPSENNPELRTHGFETGSLLSLLLPFSLSQENELSTWFVSNIIQIFLDPRSFVAFPMTLFPLAYGLWDAVFSSLNCKK